MEFGGGKTWVGFMVRGAQNGWRPYVTALSHLARNLYAVAGPEPMGGSHCPITDADITFFFAQIVESLSQASPCARHASGPRDDDPRLHFDPHASVPTVCDAAAP